MVCRNRCLLDSPHERILTTMATETTVKPVVSLIKMALLLPSPTNPRKTFDDASLKELAESLKQQGMLSPMLVRPVKDKFEIVCGERRYRAAKLATFREAPCYVRKDLTDEQVVEMQITENLHREDVHPIEEMESYQLLMK